MKITSPIHPTRCFQLDKNFHKKCEAAYLNLPQFRSLIESLDYTCQLATERLDIRSMMAESFGDVQGALYMNSRTTQAIIGFVQFWYKSRQIFSFDRVLADALSRTDVSEIPWEAIKLPYERLYIHFGTCLTESQLCQDREYRIDGAYVNHFSDSMIPELAHRDVLEITFTGRLYNYTYDEIMGIAPEWAILSDPEYGCVLAGGKGTTIGDALQQGTAASLMFYDRMDETIYRNSFLCAQKFHILPDSTKDTPFRDRYLRSERLVAEALPLLINCLFYLAYSYPATAPSYPPDAPRTLTRKIESTTSDNKQRVLSEEMERLGYTKIHFVSHAGITKDPPLSETGKTIRSHWRRGHWRLQRYGTGLVQLKLLWIKPTIVNASDEPPAIGREYEVEP